MTNIYFIDHDFGSDDHVVPDVIYAENPLMFRVYLHISIGDSEPELYSMLVATKGYLEMKGSSYVNKCFLLIYNKPKATLIEDIKSFILKAIDRDSSGDPKRTLQRMTDYEFSDFNTGIFAPLSPFN